MYGSYYVLSGNTARYTEANGIDFVLDDANRVFGLGSVWSPGNFYGESFALAPTYGHFDYASLNFAFDFSV